MTRPSSKDLSASLGEALNPPAKRKPARATDLSDYDDEPVAPPNPTSRGVTPPDPTRPISPAKNYNKRANSLDKLALPAGIFPGSSKRLYDALYIRTRGAVAPSRTVRATKRELSEWSGIRNVKTIDSHLRYFGAIGLIVSTWERGQNEGALYEVLLPEETSGLFNYTREVTPPYPTPPHVTPPDTTSPQILGSPPTQNLGSPHVTDLALESIVTDGAKTSFKTKEEETDDEAALSGLIAEFKSVSREITGRELSSGESERWRELAGVLVAELKIAAARTTVSSVPAFLAEHLRRRLWKLDKRQARAEGRELPDEAASMPQGAVDARSCLDCGGSGWWYPEGEGKGVAKCRHEKLAIEN
jgi:hypothetical protein